METEEEAKMEKIEREVYKYLKKNKGKKFNVVEISKGIKHGYPATSKWVAVLGFKGLINVEDYGCVKQVSFKEGGQD